jgi:hypothetical protein
MSAPSMLGQPVRRFRRLGGWLVIGEPADIEPITIVAHLEVAVLDVVVDA